MKIAFRVDSSVEMGSGHVMRCLTLANELALRGIKAVFICRELLGNLCNVIEGKGYQVFRLPISDHIIFSEDTPSQYEKWLGVSWDIDVVETQKCLAEVVDYLIVDSYALDYRWEREMRPYVKHIMVIDDLADRKHDCDILLDQNYYEDLLVRYDGLLPRECYKLLGPQFALLRPEFRTIRENIKVREGMVKRIFIFFGGSDCSNESYKALESIKLLKRSDILVDVVVGINNPHQEVIRLLLREMPQVTFYCQINNISELMARADLCIGAAGGTTWERCCLGLPSMVMTVADNQIKATVELDKAKVLSNLGQSHQVSVLQIYHVLQQILLNPQILQSYSEKSMRLVDGLGVTRCVNEILSHIDH